MDKNIPKLTTTTGSTSSVQEQDPWFEEALLNLESGSLAAHTISEDPLLQQNQQQLGTQFPQFGFPSDYIDPSMFPMNPLEMFDNVGPSPVGAYLDTGMETSYPHPHPHELFRPITKSKLQLQLTRWPSSITKAARSKRRIARRMGSSSSSSSSSPSLSLAASSQEQASPTSANPSDTNTEGEETKTIKTFDNKTLRFLFQKELRNSDVGTLGRIVLPKKEAEVHLPNLTHKDGIQIPVRDVSSNNVWFMRYRFWPNNTSRMYVLENTGDFVKQNNLEAGDSIIMFKEDENKELFILGKKGERNLPLRPGIQASLPTYYAPLQQQQHHPHHYQQQQEPLYYEHQTGGSGWTSGEKIGGEGSSSTVGEEGSSSSSIFTTTIATAFLTGAVAIDTTPSATAQPQPQPPPPSEATAGMEIPPVFGNPNVGVREGVQEEVTDVYNPLFTDFDESVFDELDMLPNFASLYDDYLRKVDEDVNRDGKGKTAAPK